MQVRVVVLLYILGTFRDACSINIGPLNTAPKETHGLTWLVSVIPS